MSELPGFIHNIIAVPQFHNKKGSESQRVGAMMCEQTSEKQGDSDLGKL
jgi:hypothetical protein